MPKQKKPPIDEILRLPPRADLINTLDNYLDSIKGPKRPALTSNATDSFWQHSPNGEIIKVWKSFLLEMSIFKGDQTGPIILRCRGKVCRGETVDLLLNGLSGELFNFYMSKYKEADDLLDLLTQGGDNLVSALESYGIELIRWQIVKKRRFYEIAKEISTWRKKATEKFKKFLPIVVKRGGEIEAYLFPYFKSIITEFSDNKIYTCLAHILKHLNIEKGDIKK